MPNDTIEGSPQGKIYKVLNMKKKTGNNLIYKNCSNLQLFKSHIFVGTNSPTKYNLISILLQSKTKNLIPEKENISDHKIKTTNYTRV